MTTGMTEAYQWHGRTAVDRDGEKIGSIEDIYLDQETEQPEWAAVKTGLFGTKHSFVPLKGATPQGEDVRVAFSKDQVKDAPRVDADGELSQEEEATLYRHYGLEYSEARSDTGLPEGTAGMPRRDPTPQGGAMGNDISGPETDDAMTRSEEELRVGTTRREAGRARLRKYIVTEQVQTTVPVQREEVRIEREPITDANVDRAMDGPELSEEEHEVVLHAEEPVVEKRVVPKERVRLSKDVHTEEQQVNEQVRKEQIDTEGDALR